jgi:glycosyltransferase involved in cell wall biosynthesis
VVCQLVPRSKKRESGVGGRESRSRDSGSRAVTRVRATVAAVHGSAAAARPDVVHVNGVLHPPRVRQLRQRLPTRAAMVLQDHGADLTAVPRAKRPALRASLAAADLLLVESYARAVAWRESGLAPEALAIGDVMSSSTGVVPLPRDEARRLTGVDGSPALVWAGGLTVEHDPIAAVRGFALVAGRFPTARLTMAYDDPVLEKDLREEIARTPVLAPRVRLTAATRADLPAYFSAADYVIVGGRGDEGDRVMLEVMACGGVPVAADVPSFRALSGSERVGALWKPGQPQACAEALTRAIARPLASEREAVRARFDRHFSWHAIAWRAMDFYQQAVARRRARRIG